MVCIVNALAFTATGSQCPSWALRSIPGEVAGSPSSTLPCPLLPCTSVPTATRAVPGGANAAIAAMPISFGSDLAQCFILLPVSAHSSPLRTGATSE